MGGRQILPRGMRTPSRELPGHPSPVRFYRSELCRGHRLRATNAGVSPCWRRGDAAIACNRATSGRSRATSCSRGSAGGRPRVPPRACSAAFLSLACPAPSALRGLGEVARGDCPTEDGTLRDVCNLGSRLSWRSRNRGGARECHTMSRWRLSSPLTSVLPGFDPMCPVPPITTLFLPHPWVV